MIITRERLIELGAACHQLKIFTDEWPQGAEVTKVNLDRAAVLRLDINWLAARIFTGSYWEAYEKARAPHWEAYAKAEGAYEKAIAQTFLQICEEIERRKDEP